MSEREFKVFVFSMATLVIGAVIALVMLLKASKNTETRVSKVTYQSDQVQVIEIEKVVYKTPPEFELFKQVWRFCDKETIDDKDAALCVDKYYKYGEPKQNAETG